MAGIAGSGRRESGGALTVWKDVPRGKNPPAVVNVVIETPMGSRIKYAAAEEHGAMVVSKLLASTFAYPANTGFFGNVGGRMAILSMRWSWEELPWLPGPCAPPVRWPCSA